MTTVWQLAAMAFAALGAIAAAGTLRGDIASRFVHAQLASAVLLLAAIAWAAGSGADSPLYDVAVTMAVVSFAGALIVARFIERWL